MCSKKVKIRAGIGERKDNSSRQRGKSGGCVSDREKVVKLCDGEDSRGRSIRDSDEESEEK